MKKVITLILLACMVLSLAACGKVEITMKEIQDANRTETMLQNHRSVYIREKTDGEVWREIYLTKDYAYDYFPDEELPLAKFMTDDVCYCHNADDRLLYLFITPDGVSDFSNSRAKTYASVIFGEEPVDETIESVNKKDGSVTVKSFLEQENLSDMAEFGVTSGKFEYVLDAKTREIISVISDFTYNDGTEFRAVSEVTYDTEEPEMIKTFLKYANQTEDLRNVTVVSNHGTEKEESKSIQSPKGLIIGFEYNDDLGYAAEFYTDATCTEAYDPYADTDSDLTIYVKWAK